MRAAEKPFLSHYSTEESTQFPLRTFTRGGIVYLIFTSSFIHTLLRQTMNHMALYIL